MNLATTKIEVAKLILSSDNKELINHVKAIFESDVSDWWDELPTEIKKKVNKGLKEADAGIGISHKTAMKKYQKWSKKK